MPQFGYRFHPNLPTNLNAGALNRLVAQHTRPDVMPPNMLNSPRDYDQVKVENRTDADRNPFEIVQAHTATWEERTDELFDREGMRNGVEVSGTVPDSEWNQVAILQKSAPAEMFAQGVTSGPTPVRVWFRDSASLEYPYAVPIDGDSTRLQASPYGLNRILWHAEPSENFASCNGETLQAYVNMGEDEQWVFFKLQGDLCACGSTQGLLVDECGEQIGDCPIVKTVWAPLPHDADAPVCTCEEGTSLNDPPSESGDSPCYKEGDILPFWWYEYLEKWVTLPKEEAGAAGPWSLTLAQVPQLVCEESTDENGVTTCTGALVFPRKKLTVDGPCACLEDAQPMALPLPTPEILGAPTLTIDLGEASDNPTTDNPCTCALATLTFPVTPLAWCEECSSTETSASVSFHVPPEDGGRLEVVTDVGISHGEHCGDIQFCKTTQGYDVICGGLCPDASSTLTCETVHLFDTTSIEYVSDVSISNLSLSLNTSPVTVLTGGSVTLSGGTASGTYLRPTGIDWTGVTFSVTIPTVSKTVVTSVSVSGCNVTGNTETILAIDPNGSATVTMSGTPTVTTESAAITFQLSGLSATFTPSTTTIQNPVSGMISGGALMVTKTQNTVAICPTGGGE